MKEVIYTWTRLGRILGKNPKALHAAWKRGKLPLTERWEKGCRVFDRAEVDAWIASQAANKPTKAQ